MLLQPPSPFITFTHHYSHFITWMRPRLRSKDLKSSSSIIMIWTGKREFLLAQAQVCVILAIAYIGNTWPHSYPRNDNHNPHMFWIMNICLGIAALFTFQHDVNGSARGVQLLSRNQTEEWKGWMQFAFIMYHYYRAYFVYNEIRVFVSAVSYYNVGNICISDCWYPCCVFFAPSQCIVLFVRD